MRYDYSSPELVGYVVFREGAPYQAAYRDESALAVAQAVAKGNDVLVCWLLPIDGPAPQHMADFISTYFGEALHEEGRRIPTGDAGVVVHVAEVSTDGPRAEVPLPTRSRVAPAPSVTQGEFSFG